MSDVALRPDAVVPSGIEARYRVDEVIDLAFDVDKTVTVSIGLMYPTVTTPSAEANTDATDGMAELISADAAVAVNIEASNPLTEFLDRHIAGQGSGGRCTSCGDRHR
ncbi:hypothetical protein IEQ34_019325 [Dendrobium chrysotoxum]|uniref:Uncharacterized protein n=1 Tax=Dendrobium chrysotoxum TaxID=161865 RepID=A0AAV7G6L0_DENCH|nr:hypothetical protein IEQ34_019325 [Dendrobium chrysotoxum]